MPGRSWVLWLGLLALALWLPLVGGAVHRPAYGCPRGAASDPLTLLGWSAGGQALAAQPAAPPAQNPLAGQSLRLVIEAGQRRIYLFADGALYRSWPVAVGTRGTPTPLGHWRIQAKAVWGGAFGARWMRLSIPWGIYGIHGTNNPGSIGSRASHGCVRMFNRDVVQLYALVPVGTPVDIRGTPVARFGEVSRVIVPSLLGSDILAIQQRLAAAGYEVGEIDGRYGPAAVAAVRRFQAAHGLAATGTVDAATARALGLRPLADDPTLRPTPRGEPVVPPPANTPAFPPPAPQAPSAGPEAAPPTGD